MSSTIAATRVPSRRACRQMRGACSTRKRRLYSPVSGSRWDSAWVASSSRCTRRRSRNTPSAPPLSVPALTHHLDAERGGAVVAGPQREQADHHRDRHVDAELPRPEEPGGDERREQQHQRGRVADRVLDAEDDDQVDQVAEQDQPEGLPPAGPPAHGQRHGGGHAQQPSPRRRPSAVRRPAGRRRRTGSTEPIRPPTNSSAARVSAATRCSGPRPAGGDVGRGRGTSTQPSASNPRRPPTAARMPHNRLLWASDARVLQLFARYGGASRGPATRRNAARVSRMSHLDPALVDVRTLADHPLISNGSTSKLRMVAPGGATAGRYGLVEYHVAPNSPGAAPHFHQTFSESFYVLSGRAHRLPRGGVDALRAGRLRAGARGRRARLPQRRRRVGDLPHPLRARHRPGELLHWRWPSCAGAAGRSRPRR